MSSPSFYTTEGILLRVTPLGKGDQLILVFTLHEGLMKLVLKKNGREIPALLSRMELVYRQGKNELFKCQELSVLNHYPAFRKDLKKLLGACDMLRALEESQWVGKPAPQLYFLLLDFFEKIVKGRDAELLALSFRLKLVRLEGVIEIPLACSVCGQLSEFPASLWQGELVCALHGPPKVENANRIDWEEFQLLHKMMFCQSYAELADLTLPEGFRGKVEQFFTFSVQK